MICWQQFYGFWARCRFVSTVQWIMTIMFTCLWFWRLRSFRHDTSGHMSVFSNSSTDSDIQLFFNYTSAVDLCREFYRFWYSAFSNCWLRIDMCVQFYRFWNSALWALRPSQADFTSQANITSQAYTRARLTRPWFFCFSMTSQADFTSQANMTSQAYTRSMLTRPWIFCFSMT